MKNSTRAGLTTGVFSNGLVMAKAAKQAKEGIGKHIEAKEDDVWFRAKVIDSRKDEYKVHWVGYDEEKDSWVKKADTRDYSPKATYYVGQVIEVSWEKIWYRAKVVKVHLGLHFVHFDKYPSDDDEWVPGYRIRKPVVKPTKKKKK